MLAPRGPAGECPTDPVCALAYDACMHHPAIAFSLLLLLSTTGPVASAGHGCGPVRADDPAASLARTDHTVTGNRVASGCGPLAGDVTDVALGGVPAWVLPDPTDRGGSWLVVLEDGSVEHVSAPKGGADPGR